jgi:hypothetical protein
MMLPSNYLIQIHDNGTLSEDAPRVTLSVTKQYDFCNPTQRGEWVDILIALIEYLRSGESKLGFLNKSLEKNMLHKAEGGAVGVEVAEDSDVEDEEVDADMSIDVAEETSGGTGTKDRKRTAVVPEISTPRRSSRKRGLKDVDQEARNTKVRRKK